MEKLKNAKLFLFDLDGTIYHDGVLIGDVKNTLRVLRETGGKVVYLTNNSSCARDCYEEKLKRIGIFEEEDIVYSSLDCAVDFFTKLRKGKKVYALASEEVRKYLTAQGLELVKEEDYLSADILLMTFDQTLDYPKMVHANELMVLGKEYIATHPDYVCPTRGISIPDVGSFIEMFKRSNGRVPDIVLGKPHPYMAEFLVDGMGIPREEAVMLGDRLYTDIQFGVNAKINTVLVLSGETTKEEYEKSEVTADYVLADVNALQAIRK